MRAARNIASATILPLALREAFSKLLQPEITVGAGAPTQAPTAEPESKSVSFVGKLRPILLHSKSKIGEASGILHYTHLFWFQEKSRNSYLSSLFQSTSKTLPSINGRPYESCFSHGKAERPIKAATNYPIGQLRANTGVAEPLPHSECLCQPLMLAFARRKGSRRLIPSNAWRIGIKFCVMIADSLLLARSGGLNCNRALGRRI